MGKKLGALALAFIAGVATAYALFVWSLSDRQ